MVRGGWLEVRRNTQMRWKYYSDKSVCGETEDENNLLWKCLEYDTERNEWLRKWNNCRIALNGGEKMDCMKRYVMNDREMEECSLMYLAKYGTKGETGERKVWKSIYVICIVCQCRNVCFTILSWWPGPF